jgi:glyoxylase-like metal-dependent hydrolase (beta-lactamase superfamily II)
MAAPILIDLGHDGVPRSVGSFLLAGDEPALVDCGPTSCIGALEAGLAANGLELTDLRHVLLTHVHLDHAGAAGTLVRRHPELKVHVGEVGASHLLDPSRLERSARRVFGASLDRLWGELVPVPSQNLEIVRDRAVGLEAFPTPGHAVHHVTYLAPDGSCFTGDVAGVRISPASRVFPAAPPPDIDLESWRSSLDEIERRRPARLCLPHFGVFDDVREHLASMRKEVARWAERVRLGITEEEFAVAVEEELAQDVDPDVARSYEQAAALDSSWAGLRRYWDRQAELHTATVQSREESAWHTS